MALLHEHIIKNDQVLYFKVAKLRKHKLLDHMTKLKQTTPKTAKKKKYKVTNWSSYNKGLKQRGSLEIWLDADIINNWNYTGEKQQGGQFKFSDSCIETLLQLKVIYKLPYRQLEGFATSILQLMNIDYKPPSYTQLCRRAKYLEVDIEAPKTNGKIYLVVDSTGLKVYGEGEWKARKHGVSKRRTWRKLHIGVDEKTGIIHSAILTENGKGDGDAQQVKKLLEQNDADIDKFSGDGAYDTYEVWSVLQELGIEGIIPPQKNANYWEDSDGNLLDIKRNDILKEIDRTSRKEWKKKSGYHRRSLSETAMMRYKTILGSTLYSRIFEKQKTENLIKICCLNKMTRTGMPISVSVEN